MYWKGYGDFDLIQVTLKHLLEDTKAHHKIPQSG